MGTNFYWIVSSERCPVCGHDESNGDGLHIGKSSAGWCFSLHVYPEDRINFLKDWVDRWFLPNSMIEDEYGVQYTVYEMMDIITKRSFPGDRRLAEEDAKRNQAEVGPNNLLRHPLGDHCIGHGEGPWDYIVGNFY
jgi:hypothetical protein